MRLAAACLALSALVQPAFASTGCFTTGDTAIEASNSGYSGVFVAQSITVGSLQHLESLSLHSSQAGGRLALALYADNGSNAPGNLVAGASVLTSVSGWNTLAMPAVDIPAGLYWMVFINRSSNVRPSYVVASAGSKSAQYGYYGWPSNLPGTAPAVFNDAKYYSFYATLCDPAGPASTPTATPTAVACPALGNARGGGSTNYASNAMHAVRVTVTSATQVDMLHVYLEGGSGNRIAAIYSDTGAAPGVVLVQSASAAAIDGWNHVSIPSTYLGPGNYWLATWASSSDFFYDVPSTQVGAHVNGPSSGALGNWSGYSGYGAVISENLLIFADGCATAFLTPTNTPTFTLTPVPTNTPTPTFTNTPGGCPRYGPSAGGAGSTSLTGAYVAMSFVASAAGDLQALYIHIASGAGQVKMALYADNGGKPGVRLAQAGPQASSIGWNTLSASATLSAGATYWIAAAVDGTIAASFDGTGSTHSASGSLAAAFTDPAPTYSPNAGIAVSLAALVCPSGGPTNTNTPSPTPPPCGAQAGVTTTGSIPNFDADYFYAQKLVLGTAGQLRSLNVGVNAGGAGNTLTAALYTDNGSLTGPNVLLAQASTAAAASGWNSLTVTPLELSAGTYWLAFRGKKIQIESGTGLVAHTNWGYRQYPNPAPAMSNTYPNQVSAYIELCNAGYAATATPTPSPTACSLGREDLQPNQTSLNGSASHHRYVLAQAATLQALSIYVAAPNGDSFRLALYTDDAANARPGTLLAETGSTTAVSGWNDVTVTPQVLAAGAYWLGVQVSSGAFQGQRDPFGDTPVWYKTLSYGAFPASISSGGAGANYTLNVRALFCVVAGSPTSTATPSSTGTPVVGSATSTGTATPSFTRTATLSASPSPSRTATPSATITPSPSFSASASSSATGTFTRTASPSATVSPSLTHTPTSSHTPTSTNTPSATRTITGSPSFTATPTFTRTATGSPSFTATPTFTRTATESATLTASPTVSDTRTITPTQTASPSVTVSSTWTETATGPQLTQTSVVLAYTATPAFMAAPAPGPAVILGPMPALKGSPICLGSQQPVASSEWEVYNALGQLVSKLSFGGQNSQCMQSSSLATGTYYVKLKTSFMAGGSDLRTIKITIVPVKP